MKSRTLTSITTVTFLAMLAIPGQLVAQHHRYKLVDITTGFVNVEEGTNGDGALTALGVVVGAFPTSIPTTATSNPLICGPTSTGSFPFVLHTFKSYKGQFTDLGALPGSTNCSLPWQVNVSGEVVAVSEKDELDPLTGFHQSAAILFKGEKIINLGSFGGNQNSAFNINNREQIVGVSLNTIPDPYSIVDIALGSSNGTQSRGFLWQHGKMLDVGTLGGNDTLAGPINDIGQITGISYTNTTANSSTGIPTVDPFLWENGKMVDLGTLGGVFGSPRSLNNRGQVVGESDLPGDADFHPFLWTQGQLFDLDTITIGGRPIFADVITDSGEIIGAAAFPDAPYDAYLWKNGVATDLGHVGRDCGSEAFGINSKGQIVGNSLLCDGTDSNAFLWEHGNLVDLNTLVPPGSPHLIGAVCINEREEIVAGDSNKHIYLLLPTSQDELANEPAAGMYQNALNDAKPTRMDIAAVRAKHWHTGFNSWASALRQRGRP